MRRMKNFRRPLFAGVCVLSLILCLATVGLWVRSYWWWERVGFVSLGATVFTVDGDWASLQSS
jgi:hypothetical protein